MPNASTQLTGHARMCAVTTAARDVVTSLLPLLRTHTAVQVTARLCPSPTPSMGFVNPPSPSRRPTSGKPCTLGSGVVPSNVYKMISLPGFLLFWCSTMNLRTVGSTRIVGGGGCARFFPFAFILASYGRPKKHCGPVYLLSCVGWSGPGSTMQTESVLQLRIYLLAPPI